MDFAAKLKKIIAGASRKSNYSRLHADYNPIADIRRKN
jgi:hypothetical protein